MTTLLNTFTGSTRPLVAKTLPCQRGLRCYALSFPHHRVHAPRDCIVQAASLPGGSPEQRRRALLAAGLVSLTVVKPSQADPQSAVLTESEKQGALEQYVDPNGIFQVMVPKGWKAATGLDTSTGILASWYNPLQPGAETLAIFSSPTVAQTTRDLGTAMDQALSLANAAPNSILLGCSEETDEKGQVYYLARVEFDGMTAGMFGSAIETRNWAVRSGMKYFLRVTTTRYRYLAFKEIVDRVDAVSSSFRLL